MNTNPIVYAEAVSVQPQNVAAQITGYTPPSSAPVGDVTGAVVSATSVASAELKSTFNDGAVMELLTEEKYPKGLQDCLIENLSRIPMRYFILDDSGSMSIEDGSMVLESGGNKW